MTYEFYLHIWGTNNTELTWKTPMDVQRKVKLNLMIVL
jgi:hypothetical protein